MDQPIEGPLDEQYGPVIRNIQPIGNDFFLVEQQRGIKGKGKMWRPAIVRRNPSYTPGARSYSSRNEWSFCATVHPQKGRYTVPGYVRVEVWWFDDQDRRVGVEGYFPDETSGTQFAVRIAQDFVR